MAAEPQVHPGRRTAGYLIGGIAVLTAGATAVVLAKKTTTTPATTSTIGQVVGVAIAETSPTSVLVSWQALSGTGFTYTVQHTDASGTPSNTPMGNQPAKVTISGTSLPIDNLTPGQALHLTVTACATSTTGAQQCGAPSVVANVTLAAVNIAQVQGVGATVTGSTTANLSWQTVSAPAGMTGTIGYIVQHVDASGTAVTTPMGNSPAKLTTSNTNLPLTGLQPGYPLHFDVQACFTYQDATGTHQICGPLSAPYVLQMPSTTTTTSGGGGVYVPPSNCAVLYDNVLAVGQQMDALRAAHPNCYEGGNAPGSYCAGIVDQWDSLNAQQAQYSAEYNKCMGFTS